MTYQASKQSSNQSSKQAKRQISLLTSYGRVAKAHYNLRPTCIQYIHTYNYIQTCHATELQDLYKTKAIIKLNYSQIYIAHIESLMISKMQCIPVTNRKSKDTLK